jgi:hypothetical protein
MIVYVTRMSKLNGTKITAICALCYAYVVNPVSRMAYSRLRDLCSVRHPSLEAYPWLNLSTIFVPHSLIVARTVSTLTRSIWS